MKRERIEKKDYRPRERHAELPPLGVREIFFPYPIRPVREPRRSR